MAGSILSIKEGKKFDDYINKLGNLYISVMVCLGVSMLKNNILALLLHLILTFTILFLVAYNYDQKDYLIWVITFLACICYVAGGFF